MRENILFGSMYLMLFSPLCLIVFISIHEHKEWQIFVASHDCKVVEKRITLTSRETAYLCNDGVKYWMPS